MNPNPEILFEDAHLAVLVKPAGLLSQGDEGREPSLVDWLRRHFGRNYVGLVHRLDRNTSGVMVIAKRSKAAQRLTDSLQGGKLERSYLAWCHGRLGEPARWEHRLLKDPEKNRVRVLTAASRAGQTASLTAAPVAYGRWKGAPLTLIEFHLETGRSHQIRVQASHEGFPLLGDRKYGRGETDGFPRPALHSHRILFPHPMSGETLSFEAPLPEDMRRISRE